MIPIDLFQKRLQVLKEQYEWLEKSVVESIENNPLLEANYIIPSSKLTDIIKESLINLFLSVNSNINEIKSLVDYYMIEMNFGGLIEVNNIDYDLTNTQRLYDYLKII